MAFGSTLEECVRRAVPNGGEIAAVVISLAGAAAELSRKIARGAFAGELDRGCGGAGPSGDAQRAIDVIADRLFMEALAGTAVAVVASEEREGPVVLRQDGTLALVIDPLDGSANIGLNISVGTIFGLYEAGANVLRRGAEQVAAGFFVYGPQTVLVLSLGESVSMFTLDRGSGRFRLTAERVAVPARGSEYAINASNYRHWDEAVRAFVDDCVEGADGPRGENFNMRWVASLVAEAYRILKRGGVFLYPADRRQSYERGRLRLVYEANPIAFIMERAGGAATDGTNRILERVPTRLHERTPLVFGSAETVACIGRYRGGADALPERSPLFARRGLLRV